MSRGARFTAAGVVALAAISAGWLGVTCAIADAPKRAQIVEGRAIADVQLRSRVRLSASGGRALGGVLAGWGAMRGASCFEGSNCSWKVSGGGSVEIILNARSSRVQKINTTAPGWRTARGIGPRATARALRRAYGHRIVPRSACALNGFGGMNTGFVLNSRRHGERRFTFFELSASRRRVSRVWVGRGRVTASAVC